MIWATVTTATTTTAPARSAESVSMLLILQHNTTLQIGIKQQSTLRLILSLRSLAASTPTIPSEFPPKTRRVLYAAHALAPDTSPLDKISKTPSKFAIFPHEPLFYRPLSVAHACFFVAANAGGRRSYRSLHQRPNLRHGHTVVVHF
jgi:hypothetical protein